MQLQVVCILALALGVNAAEVQVTPVQKVVTLLTGMLEKAKKEMHEEQVLFASSTAFCEENIALKTKVMATEKQNIGSLTATISKAVADASTLTKEVASLDKEVNTETGDISAGTKVRATEKADDAKTLQDYSESIDAIGRAIEYMEKQTADTKQVSFIQISALKRLSLIPEDAKKTIDAFLQEDSEDADASELDAAPDANGYEFQSAGVVDMLKKLQSKFIEERTNLEKGEASHRSAFSLLIQNLNAQIDQESRDRGSKSLSKSKRQASKADASGDMKDEQASLSSDKKYWAELEVDCSMKKSDFEANQATRADEIEAIQKAVEIISGGSVAGSANKHLPSFVQKQGASFASLRASMESQMQQRVGLFLKTQATKLNSRVLLAAAQRASADPMIKVKKMIKDLITKLLEEANDESDHKGYCDTELTTNAQTRKEKSDAVQTLSAEVEGLDASISKLTESISSLTKQVSDLDAAAAQATGIRNAEKKNNKETIEDAKQAQAAVAQALTVLKEFYSKAAESFLQTAAPYQGMQSENGGVVGMLEIIESDFARLESQTASSEATAQKEYDEFMTDTKLDKAAKNADIEHKSAKKQDEEQTLVNTKKDLEGNQVELDAALSYFEKLKPSCVDSGVSYEDRVSRRKEEIASMQEALQIINGEDVE